ncbi:unnamed protein product [Spirodela intermedia]|uniref:Uncharacterized protein n=1 Tax=Spirodela intermedia TaxID=51605 RepID=A0A7I8ID46_SPIIN|nr:unnamed protein product [Spirodela intermedia]CAA6655314.1 unnamed protein product [Spirodela intermedia]
MNKIIFQVDHRDRSMKWVVESSPAAVNWRSEKIVTFSALRRLSLDGEELDGGGARVRDKVPSFACTTTPCPTASWPPVTWKGSGAHVPYLSKLSCSSPCSWLLSDCASDPLVGPAGRRVPPFYNIFYFYFLFFIYLKVRL